MTSETAHAIECSNSLLRSESSSQQVVGIGLNNIMAIAMPDAVLVASKERAQDVKKAVELLKSKDIESDKVFAASVLLPSIIKRADQLSLLLFGHKTESVFKDNEKSMLGVEVSVKECKKLTSLLCISDVLCELIKRSRNNKVDVDELLYD